MEFLTNYGLFLAKVVTVVVAILVIIVAVVAAASRNRRRKDAGEIRVERLNERLRKRREHLEEEMVPEEERKQWHKAHRKAEKEEAKARKRQARRERHGATPVEVNARTFVLDFHGDIKASATDDLRRSISAILAVADAKRDEVVVRLESGGGLVHSYGLAAAQLDRIRQQGLRLTVCVDKVAASGGYMMACVAEHIVASPFAIIGSIGVVAQLPNFHRLLKKHEIDYEVLTAGEFKRTLTIFGENTEKGRRKFLEDLEDTHQLFKDHVGERRPQLDMGAVANGDIWFGRRALEVRLVDELMTSDEFLIRACDNRDVFLVHYERKRTLMEKLGLAATAAVDHAVTRLIQELRDSRWQA